jgi:hypothetical protein
VVVAHGNRSQHGGRRGPGAPPAAGGEPGAVARLRGARGRATAAGQPGRVPAAGPPSRGGRWGRRCGPAAARGVPRRGCRAMRECSSTCHIWSVLWGRRCIEAPLF